MARLQSPGRSGNGHPKRAPDRTPSHGAHASTPGAHKDVSCRLVGQAASLGFPTPGSSSSAVRLAYQTSSGRIAEPQEKMKAGSGALQ